MKRQLAFAAATLWGAMVCSSSFAEQPALEDQIVDALNKAFGVHTGYRANHAKGIVVEGSFTPAPGASALSKALLFAGPAIPITARFSDSTGLPNLPDGSDAANPHGMAIKYHLADGSETDMVLNSLKFFPVADGAGFRDLFLAIAASPPEAAHPNKLEQFIGSHPAAGPAFASVATPDSFADEQYNGVDAFVLVNKEGKRQAVRYVMAPDRLVHISPAEAAKQPADFLMMELPQRLLKGPLTFHLRAQLAAPGDPTNDATKPWPAEREVAELGTLTITRAVPDSDAAQKKLAFLPGVLTDGIEQSDDPLIDVRDGAYAVSFSRRSQ